MWVLVGADDDRRQRARAAPDEHRPHARLLERQPGRVHPDAAGRTSTAATPATAALKAVVVYLLVYAFTNLGAFAVVIAVVAQDAQRRDQLVRRAHSVHARPGRDDDAVPRVAHRHPAARRLDRQVQRVPQSLLDADTTSAYVLAVIGAVNTAIAAAYYLRVMREMWMNDPPDGDQAPIVTPQPINVALAITTGGMILLGWLLVPAMRFADLEDLTVPSGADARSRRTPASGPAGSASADIRAAIAGRRRGDPVLGFMDLALYGPQGWTPSTPGRLARAISWTSPEVGPLFGAVLARYLDAVWARIGRPDPFTVVEAGAGPGTLARLDPRPAAWPPALRRRRGLRRPAGPPPRRRRATCGHAGGTDRGASCSPTSCSTTSRSASPSTTARWREAFVTAAPYLGNCSPRCSPRRSTRGPTSLPPRGGPRGAGPVAGRRRGRGCSWRGRTSWARHRAGRRLHAGPHRRAGRGAWARRGCARTGGTSVAPTTSPTPGART